MGRKRGGGAAREDRWDNSVDKSKLVANPKWVAYYKAMGIVDSDHDFAEMEKAFLTPLPASLRINFDCPYGDRLKRELQEFCGEKMEADGKTLDAVSTLPWFPDGRGFQLGVDRTTLRKSNDPNLKRLHHWLIGHTDSGMLTRQEAVSMIPPCVLQVEPHHLILDMCAAPGSKTSQILEVIQQTAAARAVAGGGGGGVAGEPTGMVVANDSDTQRAYMLAHQCHRVNCPALVITTHMGQFLPNLNRAANREKRARELGAGLPPSPADGLFDRVLADVPCSGDGTIRKQPAIMAGWSCHSGACLFPLQVAIAMRGVALLKVGGLLVYSTCSLNPIEDEAVVATLIRR